MAQPEILKVLKRNPKGLFVEQIAKKLGTTSERIHTSLKSLRKHNEVKFKRIKGHIGRKQYKYYPK